MQLKDIMTTDLEYVSTTDNIFETSCLMRDHNIGLIPVVNQGKLVGVVTDRDLVVRAIAERRPNSLEVSKVMSTLLIRGFPEMSVDEATKLMSDAQIRRIPVVDHQDQLVGMVSLGDISLRKNTIDQAARAVSGISETRNPNASNDLGQPPMN